MCVFICAYMYMQRKRSERIYTKLFAVITSGEWDWRGGGLEGRGLYACVYTGWGIVLLFLYLNFLQECMIFGIKKLKKFQH